MQLLPKDGLTVGSWADRGGEGGGETDDGGVVGTGTVDGDGREDLLISRTSDCSRGEAVLVTLRSPSRPKGQPIALLSLTRLRRRYAVQNAQILRKQDSNPLPPRPAHPPFPAHRTAQPGKFDSETWPSPQCRPRQGSLPGHAASARFRDSKLCKKRWYLHHARLRNQTTRFALTGERACF